ncbi:peptide-methionine (S)-S-oxide reductase [Aureococcus anophagefferens]|nr:peptide-methionine (S)-S-oxide reductase [Aureococcus anophagefferens]
MATSGSDKPRVALPSINQALLTTCVVGALTNLRGPVAAMIDGAPPPQSVFINGLVGYATLDGRERDSFAREAGELALAGEVPRRVGGSKVATFAGGCFWGTELHFQRIPGVAATRVGYTQGWAGEPNYDQVCGGQTGHTEALQLLYDPNVVSYEARCYKLLDTVDPTVLNRVRGDAGTQYRHGIYPTQEQAEAAAAVVEATQAKYAEPVVAEVKDAAVFWPAENYHQQYLEKGGQDASKDATAEVRCYG